MSIISDIREKMLPEHPAGIPIVKEDILAALETSSMEMFPAPSKIENSPSIYIERDMRSMILDCIRKTPQSVTLTSLLMIGAASIQDQVQLILSELHRQC